MSIVTKKIILFKCDKCEHEWENRAKKNTLPKLCPKCKTLKWNEKKIDKRHFKGIDMDKDWKNEWDKENFNG